MKTKRTFRKEGTIGSKISLILIVSIVLSTLVVGMFCYFNYKDNAMSQAGERALGIAESVAANIDGDKFVEYSKTEIEDEYYKQTKAIMSNIKKRNDIIYIYSSVDDGDNYKYIVSGYLEGEDQTEWGFLGFLDNKEIYAKETGQVFEDGIGRYTEPQDYGPGYGLLVSGFAPINNKSGEMVGIVGIDLSVSAAIAEVNKIIPIIGLIILITTLLLFTVSFLFTRKTISNPLRRIAEKSKVLTLGDTDVQIDAKHLARNDEIGLIGRGFVDIAANMQEQAEIADKIAAGNVSLDITPRSEKDVLSISMLSVVNTLSALVVETNALTVATSEGNLQTRGNADAFQGGYHDIIAGVNSILDSVIGPLNMMAGYVDGISKGNMPPKITDEYLGDFNEIKDNLNNCIDNITGVLTESNTLIENIQEGNLNSRGNSEAFAGDWGNLVHGVNNLIEAFVSPINMMAGYVDGISKGHMPPKITDEYLGDFNEIKDNLNNCIDNITGVLMESNTLIEKIQEGNLDSRGNSEAFAGDWGNLVHGVNNLIEAFVSPINMMAGYVDGISKGHIPPKITDVYLGDFNEIKDNLNNCIDTMDNLLSETNQLINSAQEGDLDARADESIFTGAWETLVSGVNNLVEEVVKPIKEVTSVMNQISEGNLKAVVTTEYKGDFAILSNAVNTTSRDLNNIINEISTVIGEISDGNLDLEKVAPLRGDFKSISDSLNSIIDSLNAVLGDIAKASDQVFSGSAQVSVGSQALSQGATEQASSIEELTASLAEVAEKTKTNAVNATQANALTLKVKENAEEGSTQMTEMLKAMDEISDSSANISKIIKVIDDIAFQTNILALNAAVEAARAGQHGKGFAVVAEEVRNLAARSASAANETTELIQGSVKKAENGTDIAKNTATALIAIVGGVSEAADIVAEIAAASNDQASGISQINQGVTQISQVVQTNAATAEESAAASEELSSQAELLKQMMSQFKIKNLNNYGGPSKIKKLEEKKENTIPKETQKQISLDEDEGDKY